jgi:hypothetical protein|tara:strand:- start:114 stop:554 length:441 start_codon:yes stop_codon:yes gene_type:complete
MESVAGHSGLRMNVEIGDSPNDSQTKMKHAREINLDSATNSAHDAGAAALKLRGVPVVKAGILDVVDEAAQTLHTPKRSDAQMAFAGSNDPNQLGAEADGDKRASDAPAMPRFRKLQQNPSSAFEAEMNKKVESFSLVLNYKNYEK